MALMSLAEMVTGGAHNRNPIEMTIAQEFITTDQFTALLPARPVVGNVNRYRRETQRVLTKPHHIDGTICEGVAKFTTVQDEVGRIIAQPALDWKVANHGTLADTWMEQFQSARWEIQEKWGYYLINGNGQTTSNDGEIKGLKVLADALSSDQLYNPSASTPGHAIQLVDLDILRERVKYPVDFYLTHPRILIDIKVHQLNMGGNTVEHVMMPFAYFGRGGQLVIQNRPVPAYNGIPIYVSEHILPETTYDVGSKYRVYAGSFTEGKGLEVFFDPTKTTFGITMEKMDTDRTKDEYFVRIRHSMGLSLRSSVALAHMDNLKITNGS